MQPASRSFFCLLLLSMFTGAGPAAATAPACSTGDCERQRVDSVARLLAGVAPTLPEHAPIASTEAWRAHRDAVQAGWARVKAGRGGTMSAWRDQAIGPGCPVGGTLLYPFSGPDFANAHVLFPACDRYVLFGLEHPGEVPDVERMSPTAITQLLGDIRVAVGDLVERNYFITSHMASQLRTSQLRGVVPVILASMALAGLEVHSVEPLVLPVPQAATGDPASAQPLRRLRAVTITYAAPGAARKQTLQYFSLDATDRGLARHPEFVAHLRAQRPATMLLKAASYLLHGREFLTLRSALLDTAEFLVQDDTGMPYELLRRHGWDVRLYGSYSRPIRPFEYAFQEALSRAYTQNSPEALPFSFSYHWRKGRSNAMVARRVHVDQPVVSALPVAPLATGGGAAPVR